MLYDENIKPSQTSLGLFKAAETVTSFLFEDCAQVGLQYFYFEKYRFRSSITIYINAGYMILRALILIFRVGRLWWSKEGLRPGILVRGLNLEALDTWIPDRLFCRG